MNVRSGPGTGNPVVFSANGGSLLEVQDQDGSWLQVRDSSGQNGWVAGWLVEPASQPMPSAMPVATHQPAASSAGGSVEERLKKLKNLRDKGLITEEEYSAKRDEVLDSL